MPYPLTPLTPERQGFGRRAPRVITRAPALGGDLRLFLATFAAGFLFVSIFLG